jgi:alpha-maltose-1-phosphate synthase
MRVLLPISLDQWRNPIATLLRACVLANPEIEFHSFSKPFSDEDRRLGEHFWSLPNVASCSQPRLALMRYDVVHTASISLHNQAAVIAAKARSLSACSYLATINLQSGPGDRLDWQLLRIAEALADGVVSVSHAASEGVKSRCQERFLGVVPNGFDAEYFDPAIDDDALPSAARDYAPGTCALYLGALEPRKHPEFVVELARRHPETIFLGAGYVHPQGRHFEEMVRSQPNFLWLGHVDRRCVRALLKHAGVMLFPSEREGLALSVIEALGMGLPVIAQPKSSMPELIVHGENGRLHDIAEFDAWTESLHYYLGLTSLQRQQFCNQVRPTTIARYSWNAIGNRYGEIYQQLCS